MREKINKKKWLYASLLVLAMLFIIPFCIAIFLYNNPRFVVNYKLFQPQKLPADLTIIDRKLEVWSENGITGYQHRLQL
jgi:TRAP-type mannitol/chloroaromatic compound transport system permease small subunit